VGLALLWAFRDVAGDVRRLARGLPFALDYVFSMFPPDFSVLPGLVDPIGETLRMAIMGVTLSTIVAVPLSFLAAKGTAPHDVTYVLSRGVIGVLRGIPTMLWAILFVAMAGLGPLAGVFAMVCHCVGALGKNFSEIIETTLPKVANVTEAMQLDGAGEAQVIFYGLIPEVAPLFVSYVLYYFEWAVRVGTILGLVGAGGLGLRLTMTIRLFRRQQTLAIIIVLLSMVMIIDTFSRYVRVRLLRDWA